MRVIDGWIMKLTLIMLNIYIYTCTTPLHNFKPLPAAFQLLPYVFSQSGNSVEPDQTTAGVVHKKVQHDKGYPFPLWIFMLSSTHYE